MNSRVIRMSVLIAPLFSLSATAEDNPLFNALGALERALNTKSITVVSSQPASGPVDSGEFLTEPSVSISEADHLSDSPPTPEPDSLPLPSAVESGETKSAVEQEQKVASVQSVSHGADTAESLNTSQSPTNTQEASPVSAEEKTTPPHKAAQKGMREDKGAQDSTNASARKGRNTPPSDSPQSASLPSFNPVNYIPHGVMAGTSAIAGAYIWYQYFPPWAKAASLSGAGGFALGSLTTATIGLYFIGWEVRDAVVGGFRALFPWGKRWYR